MILVVALHPTFDYYKIQLFVLQLLKIVTDGRVLHNVQGFNSWWM